MERIMIIDGDTWDLQRLNQDLSRDYAVLICSRASKALDLVKVFKPSVLVLDPATPGLFTKDLVSGIRSLPTLCYIPILALTRLSTLRQIEESFDWGVDVIFSKPLAMERLRAKLAQLLVKTVLDRSKELVQA